MAELSRSHQPRPFVPHHGAQLSADSQRLVRGNSQESLAESMASISVQSNFPGRRNNSVRRAPRTNPHWRPQVAEQLSRSLSVDSRSQIMRYRENMTPPHPDFPSFSTAPGNGSRPPLITDL